MGSTFAILTDSLNLYSPEKLLQDLVLISFKIQAKFYLHDYRNEGVYIPGDWELISANIQKEYVGREEEYALLTISSKSRSEKDPLLFDEIMKGKDLYCVAHIGDFDGTMLLYEFSIEYISLNPDHYFWLEDPWLYDWASMQKIRQKGFTEDWCFKKPE